MTDAPSEISKKPPTTTSEVVSVVLAGNGRRRQIQRAALRCLLDFGVSGTTMARVREVSGASTGSLYHHFENKEALAASLYIEAIKDHADCQRQAIMQRLAESASDTQARAAVLALVTTYGDWVQREPDLARLLYMGSSLVSRPEDQQQLAAQTRRHMLWLFSLFEPWVNAGHLRALPKLVYHALLIGPIQDYARHWLSGRAKAPLSGVSPMLAEAAWQAVRSDDVRA